MPFTIATWNINSVRLRIAQVTRFLGEHAPDALALQEIKCRDDQFPAAEIRKAGYEHVAVYGNKGYHGVAIVSKHPFATVERHQFCGKEDGRALTVEWREGPLAGVELADFYVPAGGDTPDPDVNEKFAHKLAFLEEFAGWSDRRRAPGKRAILVGDLNVAPLEHDVWSHKQMLNVVSHTEPEVTRFAALMAAGRWDDVMRAFVPETEKLYTWWSYRALDWRASNRGRRLDHILASEALRGAAREMTVLDGARSWERPSDHVPVIVAFDS
jgi:exodeoxyribonuclease-3